MQPPICELCGKRFDPARGGDTVTFADHEPLPDGMTGHPRGVVWFCERHLAAARSLRGQSAAEALIAMRRRRPLSWLRGLLRVSRR